MKKQLNNIKWVNKRMYHCVLVVVMCRAERRAELTGRASYAQKDRG